MTKYAHNRQSSSPAAQDPGYAIADVEPTALRVDVGACLFRQGDRAVGIYRVKLGQMSLVRVTPDGARVPMHTAYPGELFAEASLFSAKYHCDAIALCDCEVMMYSKRELSRRLREKPDELWAFAAELAHRVQGLRTRLQIRQIRSARERVLTALKLKCGAKGSWILDVTLKHFADEIGLTHEALYRTLATLEREGYLRREQGQISMTQVGTDAG